MNPTTRRYPRTLNEAFGPYHHLAPLHTEYLPMHTHEKIVIWGCALVVTLATVLIALGVVK
jgi:hypothetical protein